MGKFIGKRFLYMVGMLIALSFVIFLILELPPGDYAERHVHDLRQSGVTVTQADIEQYRYMFGLNDPWYQRYFHWITKIVFKGDFGYSMAYRMPVTDVIGDRIWFTVLISIVTIGFSYLLAIPIGIYSAMKQYTVGDYVFTFLGYIGMATPSFLLALVLMYISSMHFGVSVGGLFSPEFVSAAWSWGKFLDLLKHLWVPMVVLGFSGAASTIRMMRATMLDEKNQLYVTVARSKGLKEGKVIRKYPVRAALNPIVATIGWELSIIVSGSPITATVLSLPDIGPLFYKSLLEQDIYLSGSLLLIYSALTIIGTFLSDILLGLLDPRIKYGD